MTSQDNFPKSDGDIYYSSEANANVIGYPITNLTGQGILKFTGSDFFLINGAASKISDDTITWTASASDNSAMQGVGIAYSGTGSGIVFDNDSCDTCYYTTNYGNNWTKATLAPGSNLGTRVFSAAYAGPGSLVCGLDKGSAARSIYYSVDGGDSWTICSTGPAGDTDVIAMFNSVSGWAIDNAANVFMTTDGGDNWSDTGFNSNANEPGYLLLLSGSEALSLCSDSDTLYKIDLEGGTATEKLEIEDADSAPLVYLTNMVRATNGNIYFLKYCWSVDAAASTQSASVTMLYRSDDEGETWSIRSLPTHSWALNTAPFGPINQKTRAELIEYAPNKLMCVFGTQQLLKIDQI